MPLKATRQGKTFAKSFSENNTYLPSHTGLRNYTCKSELREKVQYGRTTFSNCHATTPTTAVCRIKQSLVESPCTPFLQHPCSRVVVATDTTPLPTSGCQLPVQRPTRYIRKDLANKLIDRARAKTKLQYHPKTILCTKHTGVGTRPRAVRIYDGTRQRAGRFST